jgi:glutamate racemase
MLRQDFPDLPIVGIEPALKPAILSSKTKVIGVLATRGTLNSEKFRRLLASLKGQASFVLQSCDGLADAIERADTTKTIAVCSYSTGAMGHFGQGVGAIDTLVLGCTHYPFAKDRLRSLVGESVGFVEGGAPVARQTRRLLTDADTLAVASANAGSTKLPIFCATGGACNLHSAVKRWLGLEVDVQIVEIESKSQLANSKP